MGQKNSLLFKSVERNNFKEATALLDRGADANAEGGELHQSVLALACARGFKELAVLLVSRGALVNVGHTGHTIPIHAAAGNGHEEIVDILLERDANIDGQDLFGWTAVHYAAINNHPSVVKRLVSRGANVDIGDNGGKTPLWHAAADGHVSCVDVLVNVGANPHHKSKMNESPLDIANKRGRSRVIKKLGTGVIPSRASQQSTSQSNVQPSPAASTLSTQSVKSKQLGRSREAASPAHSQLFGPATAISVTSRMPPNSTSQLQVAAASNTAENEELMKQLIDRVEPSRQALSSEKCKRQIAEIVHGKSNELEAAGGGRRALEAEMAEVRRQNEVLQRSLIKEHRNKDRVVQENDVLQLALFDEQREKEQVQREKEQVQREKEQVQREKEQNEHRVEELEMLLSATEEANTRTLSSEMLRQCENVVSIQNKHRVEELEELLSASEAANTRTREMLRESEKVLSIPSRDIQLTDKKLGGGSYGEVYIAYWNGCPVAVKMLYETLAAYQHYIDILQQEVSISWKIHHPNIAAVCGVTVELEDEKKTAWIVMELLQGSMAGVIDETRRKGVRPLTLREKIDMTYDSFCGLKYLHTLPRLVLHGDIRPTNILVTALMRAKLGDLGAARFSDVSNTAGMMSPDYTPPERMDGRTTRKSKETDVYSMGVSVCELFTSLAPNPPKRMDQVQLIQQRNVRLLCNRMVAEDPNRRPSAGDGLTAIGRIRETDDYNGCPPRRMVKGRLDGVQHVTLTDQMW